ncbi:MAG: RsmE family RNA methyltransferase [Patescibacteria group bacterium]
MRLHRFYVPEEIGSQEVIKIKDAKLMHQWRDVFRYTTGAQVILFDGSGAEFWGIIERINPDFAEIRIVDVKKEEKGYEEGNSKASPGVWIAAAMIKNDNFDWILQKVTELGVEGVLPMIAERTVKKNLNMERSLRIVQEAAEQSGRLDIPVVKEPRGLVEILENFDGRVIVCQGGEGSKPFNKKMLSTKGNTLFLIGPEGGWSPKELEFFDKHKYVKVSVGKNVLRAETAAVAVVSLALL